MIYLQGGGAVTHAAILSNKYKNFIINDISDYPKVFLQAINGNFKNENRWISREDFYRLKYTEPYIRYCWSFGNNGKNYLYGRDIEPYKKALYYAKVYGDFSLIEKIKSDKRPELQHLESLQRLESLENSQILQGDYKSVNIEKDSIIYCDIPYKNTDKYDNKQEFNYEEFYSWAENQTELVVISEYAMPENRFKCIAEFSHRSTISAIVNKSVKEKLFIPRKMIELWTQERYIKGEWKQQYFNFS